MLFNFYELIIPPPPFSSVIDFWFHNIIVRKDAWNDFYLFQFVEVFYVT